MTRDDIIRMAREAGCIEEFAGEAIMTVETLERFAALVAAHEREECAKEADHWQSITDKAGRINKDGAYIAAAIRGRGN